MKKSILLLTTLFVALFMFTSCSSDDDNGVNLTGYWKCSGIGANILGSSTSTIGEEYLKYFSIGFIGTKSGGYYARVGSDDLNALGNVLTDANLSSLKDLLSTGSYTVDSDTETLILTSNGVSTAYNYSLYDNMLKLVEASNGSENVDNILGIINDLFGLDADSTIGVEYSYEKLSGLNAFNSLFK